jgi:hypothetical protein
LTETPDIQPKEDNPNFVFGGNRVISEANWVEYEARGVRNVVEAIPEDDDAALRDELARKGKDYGATNLLLGDAFDQEAGRPLQHKPGVGLYVTAEGAEEYHGRLPVLKLPDGRTFVLRKGESLRFPRNTATSADPDATKRPSTS